MSIPASPSPLARPPEPQRIVGLALFDLPDPGVGGWCATHDEVRRFRSADDLSVRVAWVTNLPASDAPHLLSERFLSPSLAEAASLVRARVTGDIDESDAITLLSLLSSVCDTARLLYGIEPLSAVSLSTAIASAIFTQSPPVDVGADRAHLRVFADAACPYYEPLQNRPLSAVAVTLQFAATAFVDRLLSYPLPASGWRVFSGAYPRGFFAPGGASQQFLLELGASRPALVRLAFRDPTTPAHSPLLDPMSLNGARSWFPVHVACELASQGRVAIREIRVSPGYLPPEFSLAYAIPDAGGFTRFTPTMQIIASAHLRALYSAPPVAGARHSAHPVAVWLQGWDYLLCLAVARVITNAGITVAGFGAGSVSVLCPPDMLDTLASIARRLGLWGAP